MQKELATGSGMWALWDYDTYKEIDDYGKWELFFCENDDIKKQISKNYFVPIYIFEDGCRSFTLKIDRDLTEREQRYICVQSEPYLFNANGKIILSGIEYINKTVSEEEAIILEVPQGLYQVNVYLLSWDEEPNAYLKDGSINPNALSDFVVILKSNADVNKMYRSKINTFSEDD